MKEDAVKMATTFGRKKYKFGKVAHTIITVVIIFAVFLSMVTSFYNEAEEEAYEMLHMQTKQIKDDLILQIKSDTENLITMANFAAKLNARGEGYGLMFDSFKPIGLFSRIGILTPDGIFITKDETFDLNGKISFEDESEKGKHITGRTYSYSRPDEEVVRSAVPIVVNEKTVGIIYGIIKIETINEKYRNMAKELDAQLFVYDKETGKYIIDTIERKPGEVSELKNREYNEGYSYEQMMTTDKGFSSFKSIFTGENLYIHYSTIEDFDWEILLGRYESQVFGKTNKLSQTMSVTFVVMLLVIAFYLYSIVDSEKNRSKVAQKASNIRKLLLEINQRNGNINEALKNIQEFSNARSAVFADTDGEDYYYILPAFKSKLLTGAERKYFMSELFKYAADLNSVNQKAISFMRIVLGAHLLKTNPELYEFFKKHEIKDFSYDIITDENNHVSILGVLNPKNGRNARELLKDVAVCFSIAIYNKKHLNKTELAATTDSLTGAMNRVAYKKDIIVFDKEKPEDFSCVYVDVNELHIRNNKYGHAAGDEMLIYIANTLKEVFFGHRIYRMGGDEFLVFARNSTPEGIKKDIESFVEFLEVKGYKVAIGMSYRTQNTNCEEMVREAEIRMYESKAHYYQNKEQISIAEDKDKNFVQVKTGIEEIDTMISVLQEHYNGIYKVSLDDDSAHRILMPAYLGYKEDEENFSKLLAKYINSFVHPDFQRAVESFLNYDAIKRHITEGKTPSITYKKANGETVVLSVYKLSEDKNNTKDTLWVFARE